MRTDGTSCSRSLQPYRSLGMPVLPCSVERGEGIEEMRAALAGKTCVFVGQSGVGKSSLLNALGGEAAARVGAVRDGDGRGRHTTTASALYDLAGGIRVIDTPGIRRFSVEDDDPEPSPPGSRSSRRSPDAAASATARMCTSPAAPCAAPSRTARSRAAATRATSSCSAATATPAPRWFLETPGLQDGGAGS